MQKKNKVKWILFSLFILSSILLLLSGRKPEIVKPKTSSVVDAVYALGSVKTDSTFNLRTSITTKLTRIFVAEGDFVRKNAPLILLDNGLIMTAPFTGIVNKISLKETENTIPGQSILSLINFDKMYVSASLDQESVIKVRKGQRVEISFESIRDKKAIGVVSSVYPSGTEFIAKIKSNEIPDGILPEMTCDVAIEIAKKDSVTMIPIKTINSQNVTVLRDRQMVKIKPKIGTAVGEWVEILGNDIQLSDLLIVPKKPNGIKYLFILILLAAAGITLYKTLKKKKEE